VEACPVRVDEVYDGMGSYTARSAGAVLVIKKFVRRLNFPKRQAIHNSNGRQSNVGVGDKVTG